MCDVRAVYVSLLRVNVYVCRIGCFLRALFVLARCNNDGCRVYVCVRGLTSLAVSGLLLRCDVYLGGLLCSPDTFACVLAILCELLCALLGTSV